VKFGRGVQNAIKARKCEPCQNRRHTDCEQELAVHEAREVGWDPESNFGPIDIPFCACYSETDLHI
jgi:hypothetical protein